MQRLLWYSPRHVTSRSHSFRRCNAQGQVLIAPEYELDGWTTSLPAGQFSSANIIALYADHGTHEQFHSASERGVRSPVYKRNGRPDPSPPRVSEKWETWAWDGSPAVL